MRTKGQPGVLGLLITFVDDYMPTAAGLSANTIRLYKASFRLLLTCFYNVKEISTDKITFQDLNRETISSIWDWIETERNCSVATRNIRLAALSSFGSYAQNRNTDAALPFVTAIQNTPTKKAAYTPRISFSRVGVSALLHAPDTKSIIGRCDAVLLSLNICLWCACSGNLRSQGARCPV